ncbi:GntR family transcriptional regulator [Saccharothrix violaceirubra]|uniref:GntR family transcriptional regulator n=1 Tax=Saccharothrix violaceirubra TaxID=413306 RepID=A0A7W7T827_9PSEU|nr:GntR family transcriptional regulator [Saccharothrix violaceirubra]MBB4967005.1 GntR family transcriptional regulator [Saccharothrix violaceirubra]
MPRTKHELPAAITLPTTLVLGAPKGGQLRRFLESLVAELGPGVLLPSERVLAQRYGVARMTVRQELDRLAAEGVVVRRPRHGTFVAEPARAAVDLVASFTDHARGLGLTPGARVLCARVEPADEPVAGRLGLAPGSPVLLLVRLRTADDVPMALERTCLSVERFPGIEAVDWTDRSLYAELTRRWDVRVAGSDTRISAVLPAPDEAATLGIGCTQPCFVIEGVPRDTTGFAVESGRSVYRADRYEVVTRVRP